MPTDCCQWSILHQARSARNVQTSLLAIADRNTARVSTAVQRADYLGYHLNEFFTDTKWSIATCTDSLYRQFTIVTSRHSFCEAATFTLVDLLPTCSRLTPDQHGTLRTLSTASHACILGTSCVSQMMKRTVRWSSSSDLSGEEVDSASLARRMFCAPGVR